MSEFNKKVGKKGLAGLLNKDEPEPVKRSTWKSGGGYGSSGYDRGYGSTYPYRGGYGSHRGGNPAYDNIGSPVGSGSSMGPLLSYQSGGNAFVSEQEARRIVNLLMEDMRMSVKRYGMHWSFPSDGVINDFMEDILFCGEMRFRTKGGTALVVRPERDMCVAALEDDDEDIVLGTSDS